MSLPLLGLPLPLLGVGVFSVGLAALSGLLPLPLLPLSVLDRVGVASDAVFPWLPLPVLVGVVVLGSSAASASGCCGFLPSFGGDATPAGFGVSLGASSGFLPFVCSNFGLGFSVFFLLPRLGCLRVLGCLCPSLGFLPF